MFPFLDLKNVGPDLPAKPRRPADELELMIHFPVSPGHLRNAQVIDDWVVVVTPIGVRLMGNVTGHLRPGDRAAVTSPLWAADPAGRRVRTTSRFYQLGEPADTAVCDVIASACESSRDDVFSEDK
jgi:hypothetical protein